MSVPWAGRPDVPGNASGGALSGVGRRHGMATKYMFPYGFRFCGRDMAGNGFSWHEAGNGAGLFYFVEGTSGSPLSAGRSIWGLVAGAEGCAEFAGWGSGKGSWGCAGRMGWQVDFLGMGWRLFGYRSG